jgi:hypothetical protein
MKHADQLAFNTKTAGKKAGKLGAKGYMTVGLRINGKAISMAAHRVVWAIHHGRWPEMHIDHINRVRNDNRIENLRDVTPAENNRNAANKRVYPYVAPHTNGGGRFAAQVKIGARDIHIGVFDSAEEANAHRLNVCAELEVLARSLAKKSKIGGPSRSFGNTLPPSDADAAAKKGTP